MLYISIIVSYWALLIAISWLYNVCLLSIFQIGFNLDHDTMTGSLGGAVPRVRWDTDEIPVAGLFDVQVR